MRPAEHLTVFSTSSSSCIRVVSSSLLLEDSNLHFDAACATAFTAPWPPIVSSCIKPYRINLLIACNAMPVIGPDASDERTTSRKGRKYVRASTSARSSTAYRWSCRVLNDRRSGVSCCEKSCIRTEQLCRHCFAYALLGRYGVCVNVCLQPDWIPSTHLNRHFALEPGLACPSTI